MRNIFVIMLRNKKRKEKLFEVLNFIRIIVYFLKFCIFSFMNDGDIRYFFKINFVILEFKMVSMVKVLWKLAEI